MKKILIKQFAGTNHSWAVCSWGWANGLANNGHCVDIFSTDGNTKTPPDLKSNLIGYVDQSNSVIGKIPDNSYDIALSYTAMKNFPNYLSHGKLKLGVWCYEWAGKNVIPTGFAKHINSCDYMLPPSEFAKQVLVDSKVNSEKLKVIPHGIYKDAYSKNSKVFLHTNKKFKILVNIAQNHLRKNIPGLFEAYGKAFTSKDDVCLVLKGNLKKPDKEFEVSTEDIYKSFKLKYKNSADVLFFNDFMDDISPLYRSVDATFTMTHCECFTMPLLESIASGKLVIAPNYGGHLDFLDSSNSLLINGAEVNANQRSMYWEAKPNAKWFLPNIDDSVSKLRFAYDNFEAFNSKIEQNRHSILENYSWDNVAKKMLELQ